MTHTFSPIVPRWWSHAQRTRLARLQAEGAWIGYWCSNDAGQPARYGHPLDTPARIGAVHTEAGPLRSNCGRGQLHATRDPLRWPGTRVWLIALLGEVRETNDKAWALKREVIGEIMPSDAYRADNVRTMVRAMGADLCGADLCGADLRDADLRDADLRDADLYGADLSYADLYGANFD